MSYDWIKIKNYYITHEISLKKLAKKFKVGMAALSEHSRKEKWVELKQKKHDEISKKAEQKITECEINKKVAANTLHTELYDKGLEVINMLLEMYMNDIKEGKKKTKASACNIDYLMSAVAKAQKGQRLSLNIDDKDVLKDIEPEIAIIQGINLDEI